MTASAATGAAVELYFEFKLLARDRVLLRRVTVDQWAGGRLRMRAAPVAAEGAAGPSRRFVLERPLEDPWVFRWYDVKDEVKLGAAVSVPDPEGDPYGALYPRLEPLARRRYAEWWDADRVEPTAPRQPPWSARTSRFWAVRHRVEGALRDPLHADPVYPFHVLGDPAGRFAFETRPDGSVIAGTIADRMSEPWLPAGWSDWLRGRRTPGYGYWETGRRPDWEPRTYPAIAAALALLEWSCVEADRPSGPCRGPGSPEPLSLAGRIAAVVETLNPRLGGRLRWAGATPVEVREVTATGPDVEVVAASGEIAPDGEPAVRLRVWRYTRRAGPTGPPAQDEVQVLAESRDDDSLKLWIRIGYRPAGDRAGARQVPGGNSASASSRWKWCTPVSREGE